MLDPTILRADFVAALRLNPTLMALLEQNPDNVVEYIDEDNGDLFSTIRSLTPPKILVIDDGAQPQGFPSTRRRSFRIVIRPRRGTSPQSFEAAIANGIPTGSSLAMEFMTINDKYSSMRDTSSRRNSIPISENSSLDYWEILTAFTSKGTE